MSILTGSDRTGVIRMSEQGDRQRSPGCGAEEPIDEAILAELLDVMGDGVADGIQHAFDLFLDGVPVRLAAMEAALAGGRFDDARRAAHSLRGSAGAFGARALGHLAGRQEQVCGEADGPAASALLDALRAEFSSVEAVLRTRLGAAAA